MPYLIKQTSTGKWVARAGSKKSYTNDRNKAAEFRTAQDAQKEACEKGESVWFDMGEAIEISR